MCGVSTVKLGLEEYKIEENENWKFYFERNVNLDFPESDKEWDCEVGS